MTTTWSTPLTSLWRDRPPGETDAELTERYDDVVVGAGITGLVTALLHDGGVVARLDPVSQPHPCLPR